MTIHERVERWVDWYTRGVSGGAERREEIMSDLWEQAQSADPSTASEASTRSRWLRGIPADLSWRSTQLRTAAFRARRGLRALFGLLVAIAAATTLLSVAIAARLWIAWPLAPYWMAFAVSGCAAASSVLLYRYFATRAASWLLASALVMSTVAAVAVLPYISSTSSYLIVRGAELAGVPALLIPVIIGGPPLVVAAVVIVAGHRLRRATLAPS